MQEGRTPWGFPGGSPLPGEPQEDALAAASPRRAGQEPPHWFRLGFARLAPCPAPPSPHPSWRLLSSPKAFLLLLLLLLLLFSFPKQDELEFGYVEAPHKTFPVVFDSPRNRGLKDFAFKKILVRP